MFIGDRVKVRNQKLLSDGTKGQVTFVYPGSLCAVVLDNGRNIKIKKENLVKVTPTVRYDDPNIKYPKENHLAYIYMHDEDRNPVNIDEAIKDHNLEDAYEVMRGTKDEIIDVIKDNLSTWKNAFVVIDGKFHGVEHIVHIKGL